ncbi:MAG: S49 family peptidase [Vicinamibacterales bacterium]
MTTRDILDAVPAFPATVVAALSGGEGWAIERGALRALERAATDPTAAPRGRVATRAEGALDWGPSGRALLAAGVAVIPITGVIQPRADSWSRWAGWTALDELLADLATAIGDVQVKSILLDVDSPGGLTRGMAEAAEAVFAVRGVKPIVAHSGGQMTSAALWLGANADEVVITPVAVLGSVGVRTTAMKFKQPGMLFGEQLFDIASSGAPFKTPDPESDEGLAAIRRPLDSLEAVFVAGLARARGTTPERVLADYGRGGLLAGADAVAAGMADRIASFADTLASLAGAAGSGGPSAVHHEGTETMTTDPVKPAASAPGTPLTADQVRSDHAAAAAAIAADAAKAERERVKAIHAAALPGFEAQASAAIEAGTTAEAFAMEQLKALKAKGPEALAAMRADLAAAATPSEPETPAAGTTVAAAPSATGADRAKPAVADAGDPVAVEAAAKADWAANKGDVRAEFVTEASYVAFRLASARGLIRGGQKAA